MTLRERLEALGGGTPVSPNLEGMHRPALRNTRAYQELKSHMHMALLKRIDLEAMESLTPENLSDELRADWGALGFDAEAFLSRVGLKHPVGERGRTALEMVWNRPTFEINGITGGYTGDGFKTVLPAEARAKVSFRLTGTQVMASNSPPNSSAAQRAMRLPKQGSPPMRPLNLKSSRARRTASS